MTLKSEWKRVALYGLALAAGTTVLQWFDYQRFSRLSSLEVYVTLVAAGFLALGLFLGMRLLAAPALQRLEGNPEATAALGISPRELAVLQALSAGLSNKEIARELGVSPNTIKTHVTRLFEKLDAHRRTDAINKARQLGIVP
jgi:DNA-binding NarL/FixJ family response regulator